MIINIGGDRIVGTGGSGASGSLSSANAAIIGDSLTDYNFGRLDTFHWINAVNGGKLALIHNAGYSGNTVGNVLARVDNQWDNPSANLVGLAGLGTYGVVAVRIGTNDARNNTAIAGALTTDYNSLMSKLAGYADKVIVLSVPPTSDGIPAHNTRVQEYNAFLLANYNSGKFLFVDDCVNVRDGSNNQITSFFVDGIHFDDNGVYEAGITGGADSRIAPLVASLASPTITSAADIYPAQPQWVVNPTMTGTAGSAGSGGVSGQIATSWTIAGNATSIVCSKIAAAGGDTNTGAWQGIDIQSGTAGQVVTINPTLSGRALSTSDPSRIDAFCEFEFVSVDTSKLGLIRMEGRISSDWDVPYGYLSFGGLAGTYSARVVLRHKLARIGSAGSSGHSFNWVITLQNNVSGSIGMIKFRGMGMRG